MTFRFNIDGTVSILNTRQLESLEEKLTQQGKTTWELTCKECGDEAEIEFNEYESADDHQQQKHALEGM